MKPFALDTVLKFREQLENQAKNNLFAARRQRESVEMLLNTSRDEYKHLLVECEELKQHEIAIEDLIQMETRLSFSQKHIVDLEKLLAEKQAAEQKAHNLLVLRAKEKRVLEKLKQTQNAQWQRYISKKEAAMLDEIAILRHNRH